MVSVGPHERRASRAYTKGGLAKSAAEVLTWHAFVEIRELAST